MTNVYGQQRFKSVVSPGQALPNSNIYQSSINYGTPKSYINTGFNQGNKGKMVNYYTQPTTNIYQSRQLKTQYYAPALRPVKVLPTRYLPVKVIRESHPLKIIDYTQPFKYNTQNNNLHIISNNNTIQQTNTYNNTTTITPVTNISYINEKYNNNNYYQAQNISQGYINSVATTSNINYTSPINRYQTQKETKNLNYQVTQNRENINNNENKEYYVNSHNYVNSDDSQYSPRENMAHSYILNSPLVKKKIDIFSEIQSPISKYETQSYNQENTIYRLENEIFNLKAENEAFKKRLDELDRYRAEAAEARALKEQLEQLLPLRDQMAEMASLKAQLAELDGLKKKMKELGDLKAQMDKITKKKIKYKSLKKNVVKSTKTEVEQKTNIGSVKESEQRNTNIKRNIDKRNIIFEEQTEKTFVNGDIIHSVEELEMLVRKINKSSKKITLNLIYKATADSDKAQEFHQKCDKAKSTLVLIETDKGKRFGGYTSATWEGRRIDKLDPDAFIFSLDKMKIYENIHGKKAIGCYPKFGPVFLGCQIRIYDNAFQRGGTTFEKGLNYNTKKDYELTDGEKKFNVKEIEVYEIIAQ